MTVELFENMVVGFAVFVGLPVIVYEWRKPDYAGQGQSRNFLQENKEGQSSPTSFQVFMSLFF